MSGVTVLTSEVEREADHRGITFVEALELVSTRKRYQAVFGLVVEPPERPHPTLSATKVCWICELPLGTKHGHPDLMATRDHVVPRSAGGKGYLNIKKAHRWCNMKRGVREVRSALKISFRERMLAVHGKTFGSTV